MLTYFYDIESVSNVFTLANWRTQDNVLELYVLLDDPMAVTGQNHLGGYVANALQKSELFSVTIRENIRWGRDGASDQELREAASDAQAAEFIESKPEGYDTMVAEKGMSLSGGQKQRLSISRALLKKAEILIFDDSTSALDLKTEAKLYEALRTKYPDVTKIIIAQRIASVKGADRIAVLDNGRIAACDTHEKLMESCSIYQDIYRSQLKADSEPGVSGNETPADPAAVVTQ